MSLSIKKKKVGRVIASKMDKTAVVVVSRRVKSPYLQKFYTERKKFKAHDEKNECKAGDSVQIMECNPISREKRWKVTQILEKAGGV
ncbi:MAG: 30S ribosomal protein S17 [Deltaproteobacteria bacterium]|nr:30S ribosomal protein S17 [Deltaproteobacteria bacterium]